MNNNEQICHFNLKDTIYNTNTGFYDMDEFDVIHIGHRYKLNIKQMKLSDDYIFHYYYWRTLILRGKKESILDNETMNKLSDIVNKLCTAVLLKGELRFEDYGDNYTYFIIKSKGLYFSSIPIT